MKEYSTCNICLGTFQKEQEEIQTLCHECKQRTHDAIDSLLFYLTEITENQQSNE